MSPTSIPTVTSALARPFASELQKRGFEVEPVLQAVGLKPEHLLDSDVFIAAQNWYDFADSAADILNNSLLGYQIGATAAIETLPNLRVLELPHSTLGELLTALVIDVRRFSTIARYALRTDGTTASLTTHRSFTPNSPPAQIDGYFAGFMVRILQLCSEQQMSLRELEIGVCDPSALPETSVAEYQIVKVGLEGATFRFPALWLLHRSDGFLRQASILAEKASENFLDAFTAMLDLHLDKQNLSLAAFASLTGQSKTTLKRRLQSHGTTYQTELDKRRTSRANYLLEETEMTAGQVGANVGYPDPPSFSRAFKRWTSLTPVEHRKQHEILQTRNHRQGQQLRR